MEIKPVHLLALFIVPQAHHMKQLSVTKKEEVHAIHTHVSSVVHFRNVIQRMKPHHQCLQNLLWDEEEEETVDEVPVYLLIGKLDQGQSLQEKWKSRATTYPGLLQEAQEVLCKPVSSASSERIFSRAVVVIHNKCNRIALENVNDLLMVP
ncbi:uncharacterized protein LOC124721905 isoform X2 [Schistocerca piceifrons]|nr:uncharacterized protein LOC124721905 isoform X2 [Schistocerca piceifrons]